MKSEKSLNSQLHTDSLQKEELLSVLMGNSAVSCKNIDKLTKRKLLIHGKTVHGLSSEAIDVYLYLCANANAKGEINHFSYYELVNNNICSSRAVYDIFDTLENFDLIRVIGKKYYHYKKIILKNYKINKKERFLNLNRTYFRMGTEDYYNFQSLSAGSKSLLLFALYKANLKPDANNNLFEINIDEFAKYMRIKKQTIIKYIKQINDTFHYQILNISAYKEYRHSDKIYTFDKRFHYKSLSISKDLNYISLLKNDSSGFWRDFRIWLEKHNFEERTIRARELQNSNTWGSDEELKERNRNYFFQSVYSLIHNNISFKEIYKIVYQTVKMTGFFDESVTYALFRMMQSKNIQVIIES